MRSAWVLIAFAASCSPAALPPQQYAPSEVTELGGVPSGYVSGPSIAESCRVTPRRSFEDEPLSNVDCSFERLSRGLAARAGEQGARFLVSKRCRSGSGSRLELTCNASVARPTGQVPLRETSPVAEGPALSPARVADWDEPRPQDAARIRVSFRPVVPGGAPELPPRHYDRVDETAQPSVGRRPLGQVSARCAACEASSLRHALRVTAGRVGAGEVSGVACFEEGEGTRCVATALVPWSS